MCGRFTIIDPIEQIMDRYTASMADGFEYKPNYNAAPMQYIPTSIRSKEGIDWVCSDGDWSPFGPRRTRSVTR
nr:SOS response-associated peptidase family protein [Paenibacillus sp. LK1]